MNIYKLTIKSILILFFFINSFANFILAQDAVTTLHSNVIQCPKTLFSIPLTATNIANIDSLFLKIDFNNNDLIYKSYQKANQMLLSNGFLSVEKIETGIVIKWKSENPTTLNNDTLMLLNLISIENNVKPNFDEAVCYYKKSDGTQLNSLYYSSEITLFPKISIKLQELESTCAGKTDAIVAAYAVGGLKPYSFLWNGAQGTFDSVQTNLAGGRNNLKITDANGCICDTNFIVSELAASKVEILCSPDTVYIQNPIVDFSFEDDANIASWKWKMGDNSESVERNHSHLYLSANDKGIDKYLVSLYLVNASGCDTVITKELIVSEAKIKIPNVFTPNGDNINDKFEIVNPDKANALISSEFKRIELLVLDRWGRTVYHNFNYKHDWGGDGVADGVYFYRVKTYGQFKDEIRRGSVTIIRGK